MMYTYRVSITPPKKGEIITEEFVANSEDELKARLQKMFKGHTFAVLSSMEGVNASDQYQPLKYAPPPHAQLNAVSIPKRRK